MNECTILRKNGKEIKLTEANNRTYAKIGKKTFTLPYKLKQAIRFLEISKII